MFSLNRNCTTNSDEQCGGRKQSLCNEEQEQHMFCIQPTAVLNDAAWSHMQNLLARKTSYLCANVCKVKVRGNRGGSWRPESLQINIL